jgi:hypothetical protein
MFFLNGLAGTEKTFIYNTITTKLWIQKMIVVSIASFGIAAILLIGGRTTHTTFKISINIHKTSICSICKQSEYVVMLHQAKFLIWNELPI